MKISFTIIATMLLCLTLHAQAQTPAPPQAPAGAPLTVGELQLVFREGVDPAKLDALVADTRKRSSEMRAQGIKDELAKDGAHMSGPWLYDWIMATLYQGDRAKDANAVLRIQRNAYEPKDDDEQVVAKPLSPNEISIDEIMAAPSLGDRAKEADSMLSEQREILLRDQKKIFERQAAKKAAAKRPSPKEIAKADKMREMQGLAAGFGARLLARFGRHGKYPGRLEPDIEAVLMTNAWNFVCAKLDMSRYPESTNKILPLTWARQWGTENQDVRNRPWVYFSLNALRKDPAYAGKRIDGKTVEEWFGHMNDFMKDYLKDRVLAGMWIEMGGHYAHINFDAMIDLYEAAPDPVVRQRAKMFLDLALIEDEQISVNGQRGGNASRGGPFYSNTGEFKDIVFGDKPGVLISDYQAPAVAIALRNAKGAVKPYHINNRVPGENPSREPDYLHNSHLVSYAYRTPGYLMGTAFRDPNLIYHPTSSQQRSSSLIFQSKEVVCPWPNDTGKGRSGKTYFSVQHDNVMVLQQLVNKSRLIMEVQYSKDLTNITERAGWIFAQAGSGYAAVRFVDTQEASGAGKYVWHEIPAHWSEKDKRPRRIASPEKEFLPIILQAGDPAQYGSFEKFQKAVLASKITINAKASELEYQPVGGSVITWNYNQNANPLVLPRVDGKTPDLQPALLFDSPFLKARWEDPKIYAGAGPFRAVYDMEKSVISNQ